MDTMVPFSRAASDRPKQTIHAAELLHDNADAIAYACSEASEDEVVVAVITVDMAFGGIWTIPRGDIRDRVPALEAGGWSLILSPDTGREEVEERALGLARLAFKRWEALRRYASKHE